MNNNEMLLLKLGEVVLKGLNRRSFEDKLVSNVRRRLKSLGSFQVYVRQSTIYVEPQSDACDMEAAYAAARQVFGVAAVARAVLVSTPFSSVTAAVFLPVQPASKATANPKITILFIGFILFFISFYFSRPTMRSYSALAER